MKLSHTLAAARDRETTTWAVADGLVQDFKEGGFSPTPLHFKEGAEELTNAGFPYDAKTIMDYWQVASVFTKSHRKARVSMFVYEEITRGLWRRLPAETRADDLVAYATEYLNTEADYSGRKARAWVKKVADKIDSDRRKAEDAKAKKQLRRQLAAEQEALDAAVGSGDMEQARVVLDTVNQIRSRLGMDLVKVEEEPTTGAVEVTPDEEATAEHKQEDETERLRLEAKDEIAKDIANIDIRIAYLGNTLLRVNHLLTEEDRDAYVEEMELSEGRLALIRAQTSGTASDEALAAALAQWESEASEK